MSTLYTIGFTKKTLRRFIELLRAAGVDAVVDIRLRPSSQLAGYAKQDDLAFVLEQFGIAYEHQPQLAPTGAILDGYRANRDWERYVARFMPLLHERRAEAIGEEVLARYAAPCLLCSEAIADRCHRRLVAEYWQAFQPELEIVHLA